MCHAPGPPSPRATAFSRNHQTAGGGSQVQETQMSQVPDLSCVILCLGTSTTVAPTVSEERRKTYFPGAASRKPIMQTQLPSSLLCTAPHMAARQWPHALLLHTLLCPTHPTITHSLLERAGVLCHTPIPLTLDDEGLCLAANISKSRLFQGKPQTELTAAVTAEFKLSNDLNRDSGMSV